MFEEVGNTMKDSVRKSKELPGFFKIKFETQVKADDKVVKMELFFWVIQ